MLYRIKADEELFNAWKTLEQDTGLNLIASTVQNDMFITTEQLNTVFASLHQTYLDLVKQVGDTTNNVFVRELEYLRDRTANYIRDLNTLPISQAEFDEFKQHCNFYKPQWEGFAEEQNKQNGNPIQELCSHSSLSTDGKCRMKNCPLIQRVDSTNQK